MTVRSSKICRAEAMLRVHCCTSAAYSTPTAGVAEVYPMSAVRVAVCAPVIAAEEEEVEVGLAFETGLLERQNASLVAMVCVPWVWAHAWSRAANQKGRLRRRSVMENHPWGESEMP